MALIKEVRGKKPTWGKNCYFSENATLAGDITMGDDCSVWFGAVLRADVDAIRIGNGVNIQDCACVHQTAGLSRHLRRRCILRSRRCSSCLHCPQERAHRHECRGA